MSVHKGRSHEVLIFDFKVSFAVCRTTAQGNSDANIVLLNEVPSVAKLPYQISIANVFTVGAGDISKQVSS